MAKAQAEVDKLEQDVPAEKPTSRKKNTKDSHAHDDKTATEDKPIEDGVEGLKIDDTKAEDEKAE